MNFLDLCRMVARESGTVSGALPSSVTGQTGRLAKIVAWTASAWTQIQNRRNAWLWMREEFGSPSCVTTAGSARYTGASWGLTRLAEWIRDSRTLSAYPQSAGREEERYLLWMPWEVYRNTYDFGPEQQNRPLHFSISPAGELCFGPTPDDTYVIRGLYRKTPQVLAANDDVPEMPEHFHELIGWYALLLLAEHDEANLHIAVALRRYRDLMGELERDQLPRIHISAGGLA